MPHAIEGSGCRALCALSPSSPDRATQLRMRYYMLTMTAADAERLQAECSKCFTRTDLFLRQNLCNINYGCVCLADKETEAPRDKAIGPKSHSREAGELGFISQQSGYRVSWVPVLGVPAGPPAARFHPTSSPLLCSWRVLPKAQMWPSGRGTLLQGPGLYLARVLPGCSQGCD